MFFNNFNMSKMLVPPSVEDLYILLNLLVDTFISPSVEDLYIFAKLSCVHIYFWLVLGKKYHRVFIKQRLLAMYPINDQADQQ